MKIPRSFYQSADTLQLSRGLLGKVLLTKIPGEGVTSGVIVETEAYCGAEDRASHAYGNRRTKRTETMFSLGGVAYVYLCYGMHSLFNIVTHAEGMPHAILIRAVEPLEGVERQLERRGMRKPERRLTAGPGVLCKALGISREQDGMPLDGDLVWLEDRGLEVGEVIASPRVGVDYAQQDAKLPYRFRVAESAWTSLGR